MSGSELGLAVTVFLACAVEAVEALTIVLAVGTTRDWRSALAGVVGALVVLAAIVAVLGPAITRIPLDALRVIVGVLLLGFGLQWLRKSVLRASGRKALHDETAIFVRESAAARDAAPRPAWGGRDGYALSIAFKGVLLEGFEVVIVVVSLGAGRHRVGIAAAAAALAVLVVAGAGVAARAPLARIPENAMKLCVGALLCAFGVFWTGEGAGARWPGGEASLAGLVALSFTVTSLVVAGLRATPRERRRPPARSR